MKPLADCMHANHIADPDFPQHCAEQFRACTDCGICLVRCHYCASMWPDVKCYGSPGFCREQDGCNDCCDQIAGPLTREDTIAVIVAACRLMAEGYRWKTVRRLPPDERRAWIKREFSNGGSFGGRVNFDGFRNTKGKGLWAQVRHRSGVVTWQQIQNFIEASEVQARVCVDCGAVTEDLGEIVRCYYCHGTEIVPDPLHDGWSAYHFDAERLPMFATSPAVREALTLIPSSKPVNRRPGQLTLF